VNALRVLRASVVAVVAGAVLAVSGCATADTAAIVNGHRITEAEAQEAAEQVRTAEPDSGIDTAGALQSLVMAGFINEVAEKYGKALSDSAARSAIPAIAEPAPSTLELVKASLAFNQLTSTEQSEAISLASKADITINPRYGTFDADRVSFDPSTPNWIKTEPTPEPTPTQG
jgi:hypothetical protein